MLSNLNYVHILVASIVYFIIGALWYSLLFGKIWMKLLGITGNEDDKKKMPMIFSVTFVLNFIIVVSTACVIGFVQPSNMIVAIKVGLLLGVGIAGTTCTMNYMYSRKSFGLIAIDAGYHVLAITISSIILTLWH
jgi:hypothetical protein